MPSIHVDRGEDPRFTVKRSTGGTQDYVRTHYPRMDYRAHYRFCR
jgi:hypothetical protein